MIATLTIYAENFLANSYDLMSLLVITGLRMSKNYVVYEPLV